jgi:AAA+ superfamily predicted ATPase
MSQPYATTHEYLQDVWQLLALRLHCLVLRMRLLRGGSADEAFLGLFLSDEEIDMVLHGLHGATVLLGDDDVALETAIPALAAEIDARLAATPGTVPSQTLARLFDLPPPAVDLLLLLLAPEVDSRFARVYAYLQDDVSRRYLTPSLALQLLPGLSATEAAGRGLFTAGSPLVQAHIVRVCDECENRRVPLIERPLKLDDRIVEFLLEHDTLDPALMDLVELSHPVDTTASLVIEPALHQQLQHVSALWQRGETTPVFIWGRPGSGKRQAVAVLAASLARPWLTLDAARLAGRPADTIPGLMQAAVREARLRQAVLHVRHADALDGAGRAAVLTHLGPWMILTAQAAWPMHDQARAPIVLHFPVPAFGLRQTLWRASLNGQAPPGDPLPAELAGRFRLTSGQITRAVQAAQHRAWLRAGPAAMPERDDLFDGCRQQSNPGLAQLARKVVSPFGWSDLVLPDVQKGLLRAIESQVRHRHIVFDQWGFERKLGLGTGLNALFTGPSGTGKTMAAGILAHSLGVDLYKIDLSGVVSKYIGETEKNLNRIFEEASSANVVLFFDEADALFGKRSEVKDAHDRYANIEISYLLQKMEEYDGIAILATNFSQNLDEAFTRRMHFVVEFPFPAAADRELIWRGLFPAEAPRAGDIDFAFLAGQFELSGGHIKNCVVTAAFLAAAEGAPIGMHHLVQAVARELGKLGRPLTRTNFGDFYRLARIRG